MNRLFSTCCIALLSSSAISELCHTDLDGNGQTGIEDLLAVVDLWGNCDDCEADLNNDGEVNITDLLAIIDAYGECPLEEEGHECWTYVTTHGVSRCGQLSTAPGENGFFDHFWMITSLLPEPDCNPYTIASGSFGTTEINHYIAFGADLNEASDNIFNPIYGAAPGYYNSNGSVIRFAGYTHLQFAPRIKCVPSSEGSGRTFRVTEIHWKALILMPMWITPLDQEVPAGHIAEFQSFYEAVMTHEMGHVTVIEEAMNAINAGLADGSLSIDFCSVDMNLSVCPTIDSNGNVHPDDAWVTDYAAEVIHDCIENSQIYKDAVHAHDDYDDNTNHGMNQGAVLTIP